MHLLLVILSTDQCRIYTVLTRGGSELRIRVIVLLLLVILSSGWTLCDAQETPCIILAEPGEWYQIELNGMTQDYETTMVICFSHNKPVTQRLEVRGALYVKNDPLARSVYYVTNSTAVLCTVRYVSLDSVLFGEERARLEITSTDYHVHLVGVQLEEGPLDIEVPLSFQFVLAVCSLVPFFLLMPDAISNLLERLDAEASSYGVYGQILSLLLPLLSIALTILLLGVLDVS